MFGCAEVNRVGVVKNEKSDDGLSCRIVALSDVVISPL